MLIAHTLPRFSLQFEAILGLQRKRASQFRCGAC